MWPPDPSELDLPPSVISTLKVGKPPRLAFGSCRTSVGHDRKGNRTHGVDSMRAYALAMAGVTDTGEQLPWPDMIVFLGDQVYADETTTEMNAFISVSGLVGVHLVAEEDHHVRPRELRGRCR